MEPQSSRLILDGLLSFLDTDDSYWVSVLKESVPLLEEEKERSADGEEIFCLHNFEQVTKETYDELLVSWLKKNKRRRASSVWAYFYGEVVCILFAETGKPAACFYAKDMGCFSGEGAFPPASANAICKVKDYLKGLGMVLEGVILSPEEAREEILLALEKEGVKYLFHLSPTSSRHEDLREKYGEMIADQVKYWIEEAYGYCQGISEPLSGMGSLTGEVSLYYCSAGKAEQFKKFISWIRKEEHRLEEAVKEGKPSEIREPYRRYLSLASEKGEEADKDLHSSRPKEEKLVAYHHEEINQLMDSFGFFSVVHSGEVSLATSCNLHRGKEVFDIQLALAKSQKAWMYKGKEESSEEAYGSLLTVFLASLLRMEIEEEVYEDDLKHQLVFGRIPLDKEKYKVRFLKGSQTEELFQDLGYGNTKIANLLGEVHEKRLEGKRRELMEEFVIKPNSGKRGRPRKTEEEKAAEEAAKEPKVPGKPGRPAGSKDRKPRKERSDKGKKRGSRGPKEEE